MVVAGISARGHSSVLVTEDGAVYSWGCGRDGRLGHGLVKVRLSTFGDPRDLNSMRLPLILPACTCQAHLPCAATIIALHCSRVCFILSHLIPLNVYSNDVQRPGWQRADSSAEAGQGCPQSKSTTTTSATLWHYFHTNPMTCMTTKFSTNIIDSQ